MQKRGHIRLLIIASIVWAAFWAGGLPSYYQQYATKFMLAFDLVALVIIAGIAWFVLRRTKVRRRFKYSLWLAFYFTIPLAVYDWLYCGLYLGHGMGFIGRFWYLSIYYALPWIMFPLIAVWTRSNEGTRIT